MTTLSTRETQTHHKPPVHNGLQHFQDDFWTYNGSTMSCVGRYQDVIDHMKRYGIPVPKDSNAQV